MKKTKIILLIETANEYGRGILRGISKYVGLHGNWEVFLTPGGIGQISTPFERWGGAGIIARPETKELEEYLIRSNIPMVLIDLSREQMTKSHPLGGKCQLQSNSVAIAKMGFEHLVRLGYFYFGFAGYRTRLWSRIRQEVFGECVVSSGYDFFPFVKSGCESKPSIVQFRSMERWLKKIPKPIGIMAANDEMGRDLLVACWRLGLRVPEEVAVIGVDNDQLLCEVCNPSLTSIAVNTEKAGFEAASTLNAMIETGTEGPNRIWVDPLWVVARKSTQMTAYQDAEVLQAVKFINDFSGRPMTVNDVVTHVALSRRSLELRFKRITGKTLLAAIQESRITKAKRLLLETDLSVALVARDAGFTSTSYMIQMFREKVGTTPSRFRSRERIGK